MFLRLFLSKNTKIHQSGIQQISNIVNAQQNASHNQQHSAKHTNVHQLLSNFISALPTFRKYLPELTEILQITSIFAQNSSISSNFIKMHQQPPTQHQISSHFINVISKFIRCDPNSSNIIKFRRNQWMLWKNEIHQHSPKFIKFHQN